MANIHIKVYLCGCILMTFTMTQKKSALSRLDCFYSLQYSNLLGIIVLGLLGVDYFRLGITLNKASCRGETIVIIVSSAILFTSIPLSMRGAPSLAESIVFTSPSAILGLLGGILALRESQIFP
jgi:hypothetical protein